MRLKDRYCRRIVPRGAISALLGGWALACSVAAASAASGPDATTPTAGKQAIVAPHPVPAARTQRPASDADEDASRAKLRATPPEAANKHAVTPPLSAKELAAAGKRRRDTIGSVKSWGYQLADLDLATAAAAPYDLLVVDATTGIGDGKPMTASDVQHLKHAASGRQRLVVSYLSIGEAEDYRPDYFSSEYLEEDAPDWLMHENPQWKGNRIISFCDEGWQKTILGDGNGRNVYNSIEPSPLYHLIELGLDGVYLDRVDVYAEVGKSCPDAERRMVAFVKRLAEHARRKNPDFIVILQNAEELLRHRDMIDSIDAIAKEDLFYGVDHSEKSNTADLVNDTLDNLRLAKRAKLPVFFVDYVKDRHKIDDARRRGQKEGFVPYFAPRALDKLWLPGREF